MYDGSALPDSDGLSPTIAAIPSDQADPMGSGDGGSKGIDAAIVVAIVLIAGVLLVGTSMAIVVWRRKVERRSREEPEEPESPTTYVKSGNKQAQLQYRKASVRSMLESVERCSRPIAENEYMPCIVEETSYLEPLPLCIGAMVSDDAKQTTVFLATAIEMIKQRVQVLLEQVETTGYTSSYMSLQTVGITQPCEHSMRPFNEVRELSPHPL